MASAAVQMKAGGPVELVEVQVRAPGPGEVRVDMVASGLCHTDVALLEEGVAGHVLPPPLVAGHEGAGVVSDVGPGVSGVAVGDHVVLASIAHDGTCEFCRNGNPALCVRGAQLYDPRPGLGPSLTIDGLPVTQMGAFSTFSSQVTVPAECAIVIDQRMPLDVACLIGCAVSTGVGAVRNRADVRPGQHVVVFGAGGVGLNIIQAARLAGAAGVIAVDVSGTKLEAAERFGATRVVDSRSEDVLAVVRAATGGLGAHHAFESTGVQSCMVQAIDAVRPGGTAVLLGMASSATPLVIDNIAGVILQEKVITGSMMGSGYPARDFPPLVASYLKGELELDELVTRRRPLAEINDAIADLHAGIGLRTVFQF
jgi:S-(hydroxymethyl)glutathione dehydrogenase/alcohol dehydrogenase